MSYETVHREFGASVEKGPAPRAYDVTLSTGGVDRDNDRIPVDGWVLPLFCPLLWSHDSRSLPIGRCDNILAEGQRLRGRIQFPPAGLYDFADQVEALMAAGYVRSVSVGFRPLEQPKPNGLGGVDFGKRELLELSAVNIPANAGATVGRIVDTVGVAKWLVAGGSALAQLSGDTEIELPTLPDAVGGDEVEFSEDDLRTALRSAIPSAIRTVADEAVRLELRRRGVALGIDPYSRGTIPGLENVSPQHFAQVLGEVVRDGLREIATEATRRELNRIRGRLD